MSTASWTEEKKGKEEGGKVKCSLFSIPASRKRSGGGGRMTSIWLPNRVPCGERKEERENGLHQPSEFKRHRIKRKGVQEGET